MLKNLTLFGMACFLAASNDVIANNDSTTVNLGHFYVDAPQQNYQFTSVSGKYKTKNWSGKISVPYIQKAQGANGIGNTQLKLTRQWRSQNYLVRTHIKQKLNTANRHVATRVNDSAIAFEINRGFSWGVGFVESGYWWRENKTYSRENTWYGSAGIISSIKPYTVGLLVDHKPTALGETDSVASLLLKRSIASGYSITALLGAGLNTDSPNTIIGIQLSKKIRAL